MQSIYDAAHVTDAHLVRNLLAEEGIPAHVRGEYLQGGMGELPLGNLVQVWVADGDALRARAIVEDWQASSHDLHDVDDEPSAEAAPAAVNPAVTSRPSRLGLGLLLGAVVGALATWAFMRIPEPTLADFNSDGQLDQEMVATGGGEMTLESDRNTDGRVDDVALFDRVGLVASWSSDDDFDGRMESRTRFRDGLQTASFIDFDGDGQTDYRSDFHQGVIVTEEWLDHRQNVVKRVHYERGRAVRGELDTDGDGRLDRRFEYDERGEPRASQD
jgi:hypothetical protein